MEGRASSRFARHDLTWEGPGQDELVRLANLHEPEASSSPPGFRLATCVVCSKPMVAMWHLWLHEGGFKKEIHMCGDCAVGYGAPDPLGPRGDDVILA